MKQLRRLVRKASLRLRGYASDQPIILDSCRAVYFPIAKVATKSFKTLFKDLLQLNGRTSHTTQFPSVKKSKVVPRYSDYFKFCFVRNPWDRLLATYFSKIQAGTNINIPWRNKIHFMISTRLRLRSAGLLFSKYPTLSPQMTFEQFVHAVGRLPDARADKHIRSQHLSITDRTGKLIVDFVGHFEALEADFEHVCRSCDLQATLPHRRNPRKVKATDYRQYYTEETWEIVRQRFAEDVNLFGYDMIDFSAPSLAHAAVSGSV